MDQLLRKKVNLLVHLARVDGRLDQSEKKVVLELLQEYDIHDFDFSQETPVDLDDFKQDISKAHVLFLALRLVQADGIIHPDEAAYCKALAIKLNFRPGIIDRYIHSELPAFSSFLEESKAWMS